MLSPKTKFNISCTHVGLEYVSSKLVKESKVAKAKTVVYQGAFITYIPPQALFTQQLLPHI